MMIDDWARLCALLDDDPALIPAVQGATEEERWMAIIDGLDDAGALAYLDPQDTGVELADALAQLPRVFRAGADLDPVADSPGDLRTAVARADEILSPHGLRVVHLEEDEDAVPLVVVPLARVEEILAVSERLGHQARVFG